MKSKEAQHQFQAVVSNLPFKAADQLISDNLQQKFAFRRLQVMRGADGRSKGYGFVYFED